MAEWIHAPFHRVEERRDLLDVLRRRPVGRRDDDRARLPELIDVDRHRRLAVDGVLQRVLEQLVHRERDA